ncbi:MAG: c-type cytochrome [Terriglobales bacterium]
MAHRRIVGILAIAALALGLTACEGGKQPNVYAVYTGGDWNRGKQVIDHYRCGACHIIPGIPDANGLVGPPLIKWGQRTYIGGELPNTPDNLVRWIISPKSIEPGTAMPELGLTEQEARDAAAYLYTIR